MMPFWQWKAQQYAKDQEAGTPHSREWYYSAYGGYCEQERGKARETNGADELHGDKSE